MNLEKSLPSNDDAERIILATVLIDNDAFQQVAEILEAGDFYSPLHRRIFAAMHTLYSRHSNIDPILIGEELKKEGSLEAIGGITTITNLTFGIPPFLNVEEYIEIVKQKSTLRELIKTCTRLSNLAYAEEESFEAVISQVQTDINDLCLRNETGDSDDRFISLEKIIDNDVMADLADLLAGKSRKIKLGFSGIDIAIGGGISTSDVLLLAADTGAGKSAFALQCAYQTAKQGIPTAFLAGEMTNAENVKRLLSQVSGMMNLNWLTHLTENEYRGLTEWATHIKRLPLFMDHRTSDMQTLGTHLKALVRRHGIKVLVIDYIQLLKMQRVDPRKRNERIAEASQEVKRLANELDIAIIEVAQFNREGAKSARATLHDLEGSGQLEKDASLIFILELEEEELRNDDGRKYRTAKVRAVKGRNVGTNVIEGKFYGRSVLFEFN